MGDWAGEEGVTSCLQIFWGGKKVSCESSAFLHVHVGTADPPTAIISQPALGTPGGVSGICKLVLALGIPPCPSSLALSCTVPWISLPGCPVRLDGKTVS